MNCPAITLGEQSLELFFGNNKLLNLSTGQSFKYYRQLSKRQHRQFKMYKDPLREYHKKICYQILALSPKQITVSENSKICGMYLEEQLHLRKMLGELLQQSI